MYIRLHNSCHYYIYNEYAELKSDIKQLNFKIRGFNSSQSSRIFQILNEGVEEELLIDFISEQAKCNKDKLTKLIDFLRKKELLIRRNVLKESMLEDTLYNRQIRFFDSFETDSSDGKLFNDLLQNRKVVIIGLGAYGTWLALHCARMGIRKIIGIDFDVVELSNLHRQILYTKDNVGAKKVVACSRLLTSVDPLVEFEGYSNKIESIEDLIPLISGADIVFNSFGYFSEEEALKSIPGIITLACIKSHTPMLCLSTNWLGPFYIPQRKTPCYFCAVTHPKIAPILRSTSRNSRIDKRAFAPMFSMTCSLAVLEVANYLTGVFEPESQNGLLTIDPFRLDKSQYLSFASDERCDYCQVGRLL